MYSVSFKLDEEQIKHFKENYFDESKEESFGW